MQVEQSKLQNRAMAVYKRLLDTYGERPLVPRREPMHELISTMLSHRTTQKNESLAFHRMWDRYGSWQAIRDAPFEELAQELEQVQFPGAKAENIKKALARIIDEQGEPSIEFLRETPTEAGLAWLRSLPGVGIKTATLVLLFCFSKPVLPVDTHVHRVSQRIGLIGPKASAEAAHGLLLDLLPREPHVLFNFHIGMLKHGQQICIWGRPRCERCPLTDLCDYYQTHRAPRHEGKVRT
jgi:endonuclease-3